MFTPLSSNLQYPFSQPHSFTLTNKIEAIRGDHHKLSTRYLLTHQNLCPCILSSVLSLLITRCNVILCFSSHVNYQQHLTECYVMFSSENTLFIYFHDAKSSGFLLLYELIDLWLFLWSFEVWSRAYWKKESKWIWAHYKIYQLELPKVGIFSSTLTQAIKYVWWPLDENIMVSAEVSDGWLDYKATRFFTIMRFSSHSPPSQLKEDVEYMEKFWWISKKSLTDENNMTL